MDRKSPCRFDPGPRYQTFIMERLFSPQIFKTLLKELEERREDLKYIGDISDLGNELGQVIGRQYPKMTDIEINELMMGIRHGISLTLKI